MNFKLFKMNNPQLVQFHTLIEQEAGLIRIYSTTTNNQINKIIKIRNYQNRNK